MSLGVPVIVSDTDIDRYYFNDSVVRFFRGGDEKDLASRMAELMRDPDLRRELVNNALVFVADQAWEANQWRYFAIVDGSTSADNVVPAAVPIASKTANRH